MIGTWHDVTIPMHPGMTVWPGDPDCEIVPVLQMAKGDACNTARITCCTHTGTHMDAPFHYETGGKPLDSLNPALFFGNATLLDCCGLRDIRAEHLGSDPLPERILFKTNASMIPLNAPFAPDYTALTPDAARRIVAEGVRLVGIDSPGIAPYDETDGEIHHILLQSDVIVVEGLRLAPFSGGVYAFTVLPMALIGVDGAPCRAFIGIEEELRV